MSRVGYLVSIFAIIALQLSILAAIAESASDIAQDPRQGEINQVIAKQLMRVYSDGKFRPESGISEADFVRVLKRFAASYPSASSYQLQVQNPNEDISRIRAIAAILRLIAEKDSESVTESGEKLSVYSDWALIPAWAVKQAAFAAANGFISAEKKLRPLDPITRSELSGLLVRAMNWVKKNNDEAKKPTIYSSLVIDCRGFELSRSMCPEILCEDGRKIYPDPNNAPSIDFVETHGLVAYARQLSDSPRVGDNPMEIKAISVTGTAKQSAVISKEDLEKVISEEKNSQFLTKWNIIFLMD